MPSSAKARSPGPTLAQRLIHSVAHLPEVELVVEVLTGPQKQEPHMASTSGLLTASSEAARRPNGAGT